MISTIGKISYGLFFCVLLPTLLFLWSSEIEVPIVIGNWPITGWTLLVFGFMLIAIAMYDLWTKGKGLPMNAYPPVYFVRQGVYRFFQHPIYVGFSSSYAGASILLHSASGLFLITPIVILLCCALVVGYESPDLTRRFGNINHYPLFGCPPATDEKSTFGEQLGAGISVFVVWVLLYETVLYIGTSNKFFDTLFTFEKNWSIVPWAAVPYVFIYPFAISAPFVCVTKKALRQFVVTTRLMIGLGVFFQLVLPLYASQKPIQSEGVFELIMQLERLLDGSAGAFPSFHVLWAFVAAYCWANFLLRFKSIPYLFAILISWSCIAVGVHGVLDVIAAFLLWLLILCRDSVYARIQMACENLANSWHEWRFGNVRIINHSIYAGMAGMVGIALASVFINDSRILMTVTLCTLLGGAIWGWIVEGSSKLLRPFGYYGALIGGIVGVLLCQWMFDYSIVNSLLVFALAAPATQAIGRLRCLVQGCCHGRINDSGKGIVYLNEHTRVCKISGLRGQPIHNTQLCSIISNVIIGLILWRLWYANVFPPLIIGLYFILSGAARFMEEQYRGETQTKVIYGLPIYQWLAIFSIVFGAILSVMLAGTPPALSPSITTQSFVAMIITFFLSAFAMGVDFPESKIPFSRLSG